MADPVAHRRIDVDAEMEALAWIAFAAAAAAGHAAQPAPTGRPMAVAESAAAVADKLLAAFTARFAAPEPPPPPPRFPLG